MDRKHEKSLSTVNEKKDTRDIEQTSTKILTVEDLAAVVGGATSAGEEGTLKYGGETKYSQRESRYPVADGGVLGDISIVSSSM
jgi:hypothetical protein